MTKLVIHLSIEGTIETDEGTLPVDEGFTKQLHRRRLNKGLTISQLSELSGVSLSHIARIERGERSPSYQIALKLEKALREE